MPVDLRCERCNKKIASVSYEKIREYVQKNGEVCSPCLKKEEQLKVFFTGMRNGYNQKMDQLIKKALDELTSKIAELNEPIE
jgi:protein-arginine kinase activator protein McsA